MEMWLKHFSFRSVPFREIPIALRNWYFPERNGTTIFNIGWTESQSPRYSPGPAGGSGGVVTNDWCIINSDWLLFLQEGNEFQNMY